MNGMTTKAYPSSRPIAPAERQSRRLPTLSLGEPVLDEDSRLVELSETLDDEARLRPCPYFILLPRFRSNLDVELDYGRLARSITLDVKIAKVVSLRSLDEGCNVVSDVRDTLTLANPADNGCHGFGYEIIKCQHSRSLVPELCPGMIMYWFNRKWTSVAGSYVFSGRVKLTDRSPNQSCRFFLD